MRKKILTILLTLVLTLAVASAAGGADARADGGRVNGRLPVETRVNKVGSPRRASPKSAFATRYRSDEQSWARGIRVKDQGSTGLCWAFAATTAAEYSYAKESYESTGKVSEISPGHLGYFIYNRVDDPLGNTAGDSNGTLNNWVTDGGSEILAMQHWATYSGAALESLAPFSNIHPESPSSQAYSDDLAYADSVTLQNSIVHAADGYSSVNTIKGMVQQYGAVVIGVCMNSSYMNSGNSAHYCYKTADANHSVTIIGWDDGFKKEKFAHSLSGGSSVSDADAELTTPPGDGAWIIQNSWGASDGENGFFYASYYTSELTDNDFVASFDMQPADTYRFNFQYDGTADCGDASDYGNEDFYTGSGTKAANVFTNTTDSPILLKAVSFTTFNQGSSRYKLDVYTDLKDMDDPESGASLGTTAFTTDTIGVKTIPLSHPVNIAPQETFSLVFSFDTDNYFGVEKDRDSAYYTFDVQLGRGQSFFLDDGARSWTDMYENDACFRIKGLANPDNNPVYTVVFDAGGGTGTMSSATVTGGGTYKLPACSFTREGYEFDGWSVNGQRLLPDSNITIDANTIVTALWKKAESGGADEQKDSSGSGDGSDTKQSTKTAVRPPAVKGLKVTAKKRALIVRWKRQKTRTTGYQIQYSRSKNFKKKVRTVLIKKNKTVLKKIKKLKSKKRYYIRIRAYRNVSGKRYYSKWSKVISRKTK